MDWLYHYWPENNRLERIWKLAQVDFKKRYYNDRLGLLWALINPIFKVIVYFLVFSLFFKVEQENYGLYLFSGIVVWSFFSEATGQGMRLLKQKLYLLESIPFNWMDIYFSYLLSIVFGLLFNTSALILVGVVSGVYPSAQFFLFPLALILLYFISMSVVLILSVLFPIMEDLDHLWDMVILVGFWGSGVIVDSTVIVEALPWIIYCNPLIGIIDLFRNAIIGSTFIGWDWVGLLVIQTFLLLGIGIWIFRRYVRLSIEKI